MAIYVAYLAASLAAVGLPGQAIGLNVLLIWIVVATSALIATGPNRRFDRALILLTILPASISVIRDAGWVVAMQLSTAVFVAAVGAAGAVEWGPMLRAWVEILPRLPRGVGLAFAPVRRWISARPTTDPERFLRSVGLVGTLVLVFGGLFLSADAAFAAFAEDLLVTSVGWDVLVVRALVFTATLGLAGALMTSSPAFEGRVQGPGPWWEERDGSLLERSEWVTGLIALNALFAAFVAVQLAVLFGGRSHVLSTTGLTYAEYARQGFFQLIGVAILTMVVIAVVVHHCRTDRDRTWARALLGILCVLTLVVLMSASKRMNLYQETYGATRLRLTVDLIIWWLGAMFGLLIVAGIRWRAGWLPRAALMVSLVAIVGFAISNPDARIAGTNVDRYFATGKIDLVYLRGLSTDAVPALLELPEPERSCALGPVVERADESTSLWSFNLSREAARDIEVIEADGWCLPQQNEPYGPPP